MIRNGNGHLAAGRTLAAAALVMALTFGSEGLAGPADARPYPLLSPRDLTPEQAKPFRAARTVRLIVRESCEKPATLDHATIENIASTMLLMPSSA